MKPTFTQEVDSQSSREGGRPKLIVLHTTEGSDHDGDLKDLASFFNSVEASSHVANNVNGESIRMVPDNRKAWAQCSYNPYAVCLEQISFSAFSQEDWFRRDKQLLNTAAWITYWSNEFGIPIRRGSVSGSTLRIFRSGVVQHKDLGSIGCGHSDCGRGYPIRYVLLVAQLIIEEHHNKRPNSRKAKRLRWKCNRYRDKYGLPLFS